MDVHENSMSDTQLDGAPQRQGYGAERGGFLADESAGLAGALDGALFNRGHRCFIESRRAFCGTSRLASRRRNETSRISRVAKQNPRCRLSIKTYILARRAVLTTVAAGQNRPLPPWRPHEPLQEGRRELLLRRV